MTRLLVAFEGWSSVRDRTNRKHCRSHEIWSYKVVYGRIGWSFDGFYCSRPSIWLEKCDYYFSAILLLLKEHSYQLCNF